MKFPIAVYRVAERSMEPLIMEGSYIVVNCLPGFIKTGDVVVVNAPDGSHLVKRVDRKRGGKIFVVGDNRSISIDSRKFGWIGNRDVVGKLIFSF